MHLRAEAASQDMVMGCPTPSPRPPMHKRMALTATGTATTPPGSATTSVPVMRSFLRPTALGCLTTAGSSWTRRPGWSTGGYGRSAEQHRPVGCLRAGRGRVRRAGPADDPPVDPVRLQLRPVGRAARRLPGDAADADSARPGLRLGGSARPGGAFSRRPIGPRGGWSAA
jgi:hypothetical protein